MRTLLLLAITFSGISVLSGCAGYSIQHKGEGKGYDVYRPEPYLLVKKGEKEYVAEIIWLPNYEERYRIKTWNCFGKADFQFDITDGWKLTKISDKGDNTAVASQLLKFAEAVLPELLRDQKTGLREDPSSRGVFHLYRFVYDENTGAIVGLKQVSEE